MDNVLDPSTMGGVLGDGRFPGGQRSRAQDEFRWLFVNDYPALVRTLFLIVHDRAAAEDIAQDAYIQLLTHWAKVSGYEHPAAWVRRVAIRLAVRETQRTRLRARLERFTSPEPAHDERTYDPDLIAAVRSLTLRQRTIVVLFYFEDRPMDEIADLLGCSASSGWVHLHRARRRLAALLGEEVSDDVR
jgi:RNA polymerase sigma factor (sigma-70 family)